MHEEEEEDYHPGRSTRRSIQTFPAVNVFFQVFFPFLDF